MRDTRSPLRCLPCTHPPTHTYATEPAQEKALLEVVNARDRGDRCHVIALRNAVFASGHLCLVLELLSPEPLTLPWGLEKADRMRKVCVYICVFLCVCVRVCVCSCVSVMLELLSPDPLTFPLGTRKGRPHAQGVRVGWVRRGWGGTQT